MRVRMLIGVQYEGEHVGAGEVREFPAWFTQHLLTTGRGVEVTSPPQEIVHNDPAPEHRDPPPQHRDPRPRGRR